MPLTIKNAAYNIHQSSTASLFSLMPPNAGRICGSCDCDSRSIRSTLSFSASEKVSDLIATFQGVVLLGLVIWGIRGADADHKPAFLGVFETEFIVER